MVLNIKELNKPELIIAASETEDEVGTVLRFHLAIEQFLVWYISHRTSTDLSPYIKEPREFGNKLTVAAAFGLPLPFVRSIHQINVIRNKLAHGSSVLAADQLQELARQVDKLVEVNSSFVPLDKRYLELPAKYPEQRFVFGQCGTRIDFIISAMALYGTALMWAAAQTGERM